MKNLFLDMLIPHRREIRESQLRTEAMYAKANALAAKTMAKLEGRR